MLRREGVRVSSGLSISATGGSTSRKKRIKNKSNIEKNKNNWNPLLNVRYWFVDVAFALFEQLPLIRIERSRKLVLKLMDYFEFHRV